MFKLIIVFFQERIDVLLIYQLKFVLYRVFFHWWWLSVSQAIPEIPNLCLGMKKKYLEQKYLRWEPTLSSIHFHLCKHSSRKLEFSVIWLFLHSILFSILFSFVSLCCSVRVTKFLLIFSHMNYFRFVCIMKYFMLLLKLRN